MEMRYFWLVCLIACWLAAVQARPQEETVQMSRLTPEPNYRLSFAPYTEAFIRFMKDNAKFYYNEEEELHRFSVFVQNLQKMEAHNLKYHKGEVTFYMGINKFSDMTHKEYLLYNRLGQYSSMLNEQTLQSCTLHTSQQSAPPSMDWRTKGAVTPVKDQKSCGSCWTFSATGAIEGQNFLNTGSLVSFSEQQIVDCCKGECHGCSGGSMDIAFLYINHTGGLETETDYPYKAKDETCHFNKSEVKVKVLGCYDIPSGDEAALMNAVGTVGPISVGIDAKHLSFQSYAGGVYFEPDCQNSPSSLDHGVVVVGYGSQDGQDYWLVKNSWGTSWGLSGYIKMPRNQDNKCGIATAASYPHTRKP